MTRIDGFLVMEYNKKDAKLYQNKRIMKLAHHGSGTSSSLSFLQEIDPLIAIASTSGQYHHPHKDVIKRLNDLEIALYSTKEEGYIAYRFLPLFHFIETEVGEFVIIGDR